MPNTTPQWIIELKQRLKDERKARNETVQELTRKVRAAPELKELRERLARDKDTP